MDIAIEYKKSNVVLGNGIVLSLSALIGSDKYSPEVSALVSALDRLFEASAAGEAKVTPTDCAILRKIPTQKKKQQKPAKEKAPQIPAKYRAPYLEKILGHSNFKQVGPLTFIDDQSLQTYRIRLRSEREKIFLGIENSDLKTNYFILGIGNSLFEITGCYEIPRDDLHRIYELMGYSNKKPDAKGRKVCNIDPETHILLSGSNCQIGMASYYKKL